MRIRKLVLVHRERVVVAAHEGRDFSVAENTRLCFDQRRALRRLNDVAKSRFVEQTWILAAMESLLIGGSAAALAYGVGMLLKGIAA